MGANCVHGTLRFGRLLLRPVLNFWSRGFKWGFHGHFDFRSRLKANLLSIVFNQSVLDTDFAIKVIRALDGDLGLFRLIGRYRLYDFFDIASECGAGLFAHKGPRKHAVYQNTLPLRRANNFFFAAQWKGLPFPTLL